VAGSTFTTYEQGAGFPACLTVRQDGHVVYQLVEDVQAFSLGQPAQPEHGIPAVVKGADLTGLGNPDMIVTSFSGGAHCCTNLLLFEVKPALRLLTTLHLGNRDLAHFAKDPADHRFYFYGADDTFAYWNTSFAQSPAPRVILRWVEDGSGKGQFRLALDKMQGQPPAKKKWDQSVVKKARDAFQPEEAGDYAVGPGLWSSMLDLIYSEQSARAWELLDEVWPPAKSGKTKFLADFCTQLSHSQYWSELKSTLREVPDSCAEALEKQPEK